MMGILVLESSGSNGSEVSAVLATQENSYDNARVVSGLEAAVAESSTLPTGSQREKKLRTLRRWLVL